MPPDVVTIHHTVLVTLFLPENVRLVFLVFDAPSSPFVD